MAQKNPLQSTALYKLFLISGVTGLLIGAAMQLFILVMKSSATFVWVHIVPSLGSGPWPAIAVSVAGGLLMGLSVKYFGSNPGIGFEAVLGAAKKDGAITTQQLPRVVLNSFIGLVTGASIGPESSLMTIGGFIGSWAGRKLNLAKQEIGALMIISVGGALGILLDAPIAGPVMFAEQPPLKDKQKNTMLTFACMVSASLGFGTYLLLGGSYISHMTLVPSYSGFKGIQLVYAIIIGVIGVGIGLTMKLFITKLTNIFRRIKINPILLGVIVGVVIGVIAAALPLTRFDGGAQLSEIVQNSTKYSIGTLLLLAVARLAATSVALSGGYQGGNIFPTFFIAGVVGLVIHALVPAVPAAVAMVCCMVTAMFVFIPLPLMTIFLITAISSYDLIPVMAIAVTTAYVVTKKINPAPDSTIDHKASQAA